MPGHSAQFLCNNENSWGPDVVSTSEGKFCSMRNKILYDVCSDQKSACCFDVRRRQMRSCAGQLLGVAAGESDVSTVYDDVHEWR